MSTLRASLTTPTSLHPGIALGCLVVLLAWLLPNRSPPWTVFYNELWMALALLPLAVWLGLRSRAPLRVPMAAVVVAVFAAVPLLQWSAGLVHYLGDASLAAMYLLGLALCIAVGARWRDVAASAAAPWVFITLMWAAVLSTHLALLQWLRLVTLGVLLADLPIGWRPTGNISQANHLASLVFLGLVSIWALHLRGLVRASVAWLAAAYLLFGMAMTQSRTGWVEIALLAAAALIWPQRLHSRRIAWGLLSLLATFVALVLLWPTLSQALLLDGGLSLGGQAQGGRRPALWLAMFEAVLTSPWAGYGWTQLVLAQQQLALTPGGAAPLQLTFTYAHNLWLDLLLWNGVPLGLLACALIAVWFVLQARRVQSSDDSLLFIALLGLMLHAQFEFPHAYAYFLLPAGVMAGLLPRGRVDVGVARGAALALLLVAGAAMAALTRDYIAAEEAWQRVRMLAARIQLAPEQAPVRLRGLDQLQALIDQAKADPKADMTPAELAAMRTAVARFPGSAGWYRLALMEARHANVAQATRALTLLCAMHPPPVCAKALIAWRTQALVDWRMAPVALPETAPGTPTP